IRDPYINVEGKVPIGYSAVAWVKDYKEFTGWIFSNGLPEAISFDHDLSYEHYTPEEFCHPYELSKQYQESQNYKEKTGKDCANFLVNYCMDNSLKLPACFVHSANPVGADNIKRLLDNFNNVHK